MRGGSCGVGVAGQCGSGQVISSALYKVGIFLSRRKFISYCNSVHYTSVYTSVI